jgi:hypothetical protein
MTEHVTFGSGTSGKKGKGKGKADKLTAIGESIV